MSENTKIDAWASFFKTFQRVHQEMLEELKTHGFPDMEFYDVLWTLEQAPAHRLRFHELGQKVFLARFNVTRICERMENQGLIIRQKCPEDKRGVYAELTEEGLKLRKEIWAVYKKKIDEKFSNRLTQNDHAELIRIMRKIKKEEEL